MIRKNVRAKLKVLSLSLIIIVLVLTIFSCNDDNPVIHSEIIIDYNNNEYNLAELDYSERWWQDLINVDLEPDFPHDRDGVIVSEWYDRYFYHPRDVAYYGLCYLDRYYETTDIRYLEKATIFADRIIEEGDRINGSIYFPYQFDYNLHRLNEDILLAPWYSGYAQGYVLALVSRIFEVSDDTYYKVIADSIFQSFLFPDTTLDVWTVAVDTDNFYWIEEYPFTPRTRVLNGFCTGIFGLYEYYIISRSDNCRDIINCASSTLANYALDYRRPDSLSYYCLKHRNIASPGYHALHINQLRHLSLITNEYIFDAFADTLFSDFQP